MSRMSLTGHVFVGLGDAIVGVLLGLGALSVTGGTLLPLTQALLGKGTSRKLAGGLMAVGVAAAIGCSVGGVFPYSGEGNRKLMVGGFTLPSTAQHGAAERIAEESVCQLCICWRQLFNSHKPWLSSKDWTVLCFELHPD